MIKGGGNEINATLQPRIDNFTEMYLFRGVFLAL